MYTTYVCGVNVCVWNKLFFINRKKATPKKNKNLSPEQYLSWPTSHTSSRSKDFPPRPFRFPWTIGVAFIAGNYIWVRAGEMREEEWKKTHKFKSIGTSRFYANFNYGMSRDSNFWEVSPVLFWVALLLSGTPPTQSRIKVRLFLPQTKKEEGEKKIRATKKIPKSIGSRFRNAYGIIKEKKEGRNKKEK